MRYNSSESNMGSYGCAAYSFLERAFVGFRGNFKYPDSALFVQVAGYFTEACIRAFLNTPLKAFIIALLDLIASWSVESCTLRRRQII
jgi:hypothetical protein